MAKLAVEGLRKRFGDVLAVDGIDLSVPAGEFLGLLGPSGCGKTTTLNLVAGFETPDAGRILVDGRDIAAVPPNRRGMGVVFQSYALFPHMTAAENVAFGLEMRRVPRPEREARVARALDLVKLGHLAARYPRHLSGGQQQRVAVSRALAIEPALLLLDEPLSNLDAKLREEMQIELRAIQRRAEVTAIIVTHDQAEALAMCDRIAVMDAGRIVQLADPLTLYDAPASEFVAGFVGRSARLAARVVEARPDRILAELPGASRPVEARAGARLAAGDAVIIALRPEKLRIATGDAGLVPGVVRSRVFQGSAWLFIVETAAGVIEVSEPHRGAPEMGEGARVSIDWDAPDAVAIPAEGRHG